MAFQNSTIDEIKAGLLTESPCVDDIAQLIHAYESLLAAKDRTIEQYDSLVEAKDRTIEGLCGLLQECNAEIAGLTAALRYIEKHGHKPVKKEKAITLRKLLRRSIKPEPKIRGRKGSLERYYAEWIAVLVDREKKSSPKNLTDKR